MPKRFALAFCAIGVTGITISAQGRAFVIYTQTSVSASGYTPPLGADGTTPIIAFDDVPIPVSRLAGGTRPSIEVTRVTYGIRRLANAPPVTITPYWTGMSTGTITPDTAINTPLPSPNPYALPRTLKANGPTEVTQTVVFGESTFPTLFTTPLNYTLFPGFGTFAIGLRLVDSTGLNGWRITDTGPDANANLFWLYDTTNVGGSTAPNPEGAFTFSSGGNPVASFYLIVEASFVIPEPGSLPVIGMGLAGWLVRRRR
ncbi:MAG: PEP-CTERM sorting domain-containing protein [Tepidisphaeraceae bacterium]